MTIDKPKLFNRKKVQGINDYPLRYLSMKNTNGNRYVGILEIEDWFQDDLIRYPVLPEDFIVASWHDYHDGFNSHIEGKTTIAICREYVDALLIYNSL